MIVRLTYLCEGKIVTTHALEGAAWNSKDHSFTPDFVISAPDGYALYLVRAVATSSQESTIREYYIHVTKVPA